MKKLLMSFAVICDNHSTKTLVLFLNNFIIGLLLLLSVGLGERTVLADSTPITIIFDQISTQFVSARHALTISVGATSLSNTAKLNVASVSGLPGMTVHSVTDPNNLGQRVAANLTWTAPAATGTYNVRVTVQDTAAGNTSVLMFSVVVLSSAVSNQSPVIAPSPSNKLLQGRPCIYLFTQHVSWLLRSPLTYAFGSAGWTAQRSV